MYGVSIFFLITCAFVFPIFLVLVIISVFNYEYRQKLKTYLYSMMLSILGFVLSALWADSFIERSNVAQNDNITQSIEFEVESNAYQVDKMSNENNESVDNIENIDFFYENYALNYGTIVDKAHVMIGRNVFNTPKDWTFELYYNDQKQLYDAGLLEISIYGSSELEGLYDNPIEVEYYLLDKGKGVFEELYIDTDTKELLAVYILLVQTRT